MHAVATDVASDARAPNPHAAAPAPAAPPCGIADLLVKEGILSPEQLHYVRRVHAKIADGKTLLVLIRELGYATEDQIRRSLRENRLAVGLGTLLVELGHLKQSELMAALQIQKSSPERRKLGDVLVEQRFIEEYRLVDVLAMQLGFERIDLTAADIDRDLLKKAGARRCAAHLILPLRSTEGRRVAMADPMDAASREAAAECFGANAIIVIAGQRQIRDALGATENAGRRVRAEVSSGDATIVTLVNEMILEAIRMGTSDIHIEPLKTRLRVRFRCDGVMMPYKEFDSAMAPTITSRIKILAATDIAEKRRHQDGRIHFEDAETGQTVDIRVSAYVTLHGQKIVMRLLNQKAHLLDIREVGLAPRMLERFLEDALDLPSGVILVTGPTGSGKTTTLYAAVNYLNDDATCIVTAEDPVEYVVDGIAQCSMNSQLGVTFEESLRHMVRQDPDVLILGEIRDRFSAETAIQAALTGHKVLTTFHTEDTIGGLLRLMNMDIETFLISSTVVSVLAQRLLRRVCPNCAQPYRPTPSDLRRLGSHIDDLAGAAFMAGAGCTTCRFTGFRGRVGVFELLVLNEAVKDAILRRATSSEIRRVSIETSGLMTLLEDGLLKASRGETTLGEILYSLPRLDRPRPLTELRRIAGA